MYRVTALATLVATSLCLTAQDPQEAIKSLRREVSVLSDQLADERAKILMDVRVNGQDLDPLEVMREAVYLTGGKLVEAKVAEFFILEEMGMQIGRRGLRLHQKASSASQDNLIMVRLGSLSAPESLQKQSVHA